MSDAFSKEDQNYIAGFDDGCNYLIHEIEQYIRKATSHDAIVLDQLLSHLKHTPRETT
jgi:transcriptional antiterminator